MPTNRLAINNCGLNVCESHRFMVRQIETKGSAVDVSEAAALLGAFPVGHAIRDEVPPNGRLAAAMSNVAPLSEEEAARRVMARFSKGGSNHRTNLLVDNMRAFVQGQSDGAALRELSLLPLRRPRR